MVALAVPLFLLALAWPAASAWSQAEVHAPGDNAVAAPAERKPALDLDGWRLIKDSDHPAADDAYLDVFPDSGMAPIARLSAAHYRNAAPGADMQEGETRTSVSAVAARRDSRRQVTVRIAAAAPGACVSEKDACGRGAEAAETDGGGRAAVKRATVLPLGHAAGSSGPAIVASVGEILGQIRLKTVFLFLHLVGLAFGIGTATVLDLLIARSLYRDRFSLEEYAFVAFASRLVFLGLALLWVSGIAFLVQYSFVNPTGLENPKVWAKLSIVAVLTLNGLYIHKAVLPELEKNAGFSVFHGTSPVKRSLMLTSGAVSVVSWYVPVVIGAAKELSFAAPAPAILAAYGVILALAVTGSHLFYRLLRQRERPGLAGIGSGARGPVVGPPVRDAAFTAG